MVAPAPAWNFMSWHPFTHVSAQPSPQWYSALAHAIWPSHTSASVPAQSNVKYLHTSLPVDRQSSEHGTVAAEVSVTGLVPDFVTAVPSRLSGSEPHMLRPSPTHASDTAACSPVVAAGAWITSAAHRSWGSPHGRSWWLCSHHSMEFVSGSLYLNL